MWDRKITLPNWKFRAFYHYLHIIKRMVLMHNQLEKLYMKKTNSRGISECYTKKIILLRLKGQLREILMK